MLRVTSLRHTCESCPAQWEGKLDDGRMVYVRYRWGYLSVRVSAEPTADAMDAVRGEEVYGQQHGDEFHGFLNFAELKALTSDVVEWPANG